MNKSIIYLAIALTSFLSETVFAAESANSVTVDSFKIKRNVEERKIFDAVQDSEILNPQTVLSVYSSKSAEEVIADDNQIIESFLSDDGMPTFKSKSVEEIMADDLKITEAALPELQTLTVSVENQICTPVGKAKM
jgi:hypothetical protein